MVATLATADNILKEIYEPRIREQLQNYTKASKRIESTSEGVTSEAGGKYVTFPIHTTRNNGIGSRLENEALPTAQNQGYQTARVKLAYEYGAIRLTGQVMELADTNYQAFASALDQEINGIQRDLAKDWNRQVFGTSLGALGIANATYTSVNVIPITNTQYLEVGQVVDIFASDATTVRGSARNITAVVSGTSITVDGAALTGAANDIVVRTGSINREIVGFSQIVNDTGTLFNVDPSTVPLWKSTMTGNSGTPRPLSESLMIKMADDIYTKGGDTSVIFANLGVRRSYFNLLVQQREYSNTKEFAGGFTGLAFTTDNGDIPVVSDVDCQPNRMYFLNEKEIKIYRTHDWKFMDRDGSKWQRVIGYDAYEATLTKYAQMGTHRRNSHGLLFDIIES